MDICVFIIKMIKYNFLYLKYYIVLRYLENERKRINIIII